MISVCMAAYNGEKYIRQQIESILPQLAPADELIISDDGSTDATIAIVEELDDPRIKLLHNTGPEHGFTANFENALRHAAGDVIFLSDQDDVWLPDKVARSLDLLQGHEMLVHNALVVDANGRSRGHDYFSTLHTHGGFLWNLYKTRFLGCCMVFTRRVLQEALPFPRSIVAHDYWLGMYALAKYKVRFSEAPLMKYRRHGMNVSTSGERSDHSLFYKLFTKRFNLLRCLASRW